MGEITRKQRRALKRITRRTWPQRLVIVVNVVGVFAALGAAFLIRNSFGRIESIERVELAGSLTPLEPEAAKPGERVLNVLLVGSDSSVGLDPDDPILIDRQGERNGDVIIIAHIDERDGSAALLSIPRDLWVSIADRDREAKINSAFSVGGPAMLVDTIEQNFEIPIHHYVNVDFAGFQGLVDALGEVNVWFERPARDWNTRTNSTQTGFVMPERGCQALDGPMALAYVRSRYWQTQTEDGTWVGGVSEASDLNRIQRQQDFLRQIAAQAITSGSRNPFVLNGLVDAAVEHVTLDQELSPSLMFDLGNSFNAFDSVSLLTYSLPAEFGWVGSASVLFVDEQQSDPILELFRGSAADDPRTIRTEIVHSSGRAGEAEQLMKTLLNKGFEDVPVNPAPLEHAGIEVRHGPNATAAAQLIADNLGVASRLVPVNGLPGRTVVVALGDANDVGADDQAEDQADEQVTTTVPGAPAEVAVDDALVTADTATDTATENDAPDTETGFSEATCGR